MLPHPRLAQTWLLYRQCLPGKPCMRSSRPARACKRLPLAWPQPCLQSTPSLQRRQCSQSMPRLHSGGPAAARLGRCWGASRALCRRTRPAACQAGRHLPAAWRPSCPLCKLRLHAARQERRQRLPVLALGRPAPRPRASLGTSAWEPRQHGLPAEPRCTPVML